MTSAAKALPAVLERIDADLDNSLDRLFDLVRIPSISTDSAYKDFCRAAADSVAKDLESLGFEAAVRPTAGHPVVVGKSNGADRGERRSARAVLRPLRRPAGRSARPVEHAAVRAEDRHSAGRPQDHPRARRLRRQGPADDLRRGLPRLQGGDRQAAARHHHDDRGRGGMRLEEPVRLRAQQCRRVQARPRAGLRHRHVGSRRRRWSRRRCAACSTRRSSSPAPTATCIPACSAALPRTRSACSPRIIAALHDENGRDHGAGLLRRRDATCRPTSRRS